MYALASLWRPSDIPWSPPLCRWLLRGRRGTWCTAKGSDVRPGASPVSLGLRRLCGFCVAGAGLGALQRGRMYAPVPLRCPLVSAAFVVFVWQARDLVHCKGVGCTPRCLSGVPWSPPPLWFLCGRRGTWCTAKGSDVRPGASPVSLGLRRLCGFCVAGAGLGALQRGRMYAPAPLRCPLVSAAFVVFVWQARDLVHCKGVRCTPRCLSGVPWSPPPLWFLCGRRGTWCTAKGSDVRPGASPVSLGLRRLCGFCVAGAGLGALQRGRMYAPVPLRCPLVSAAFVVFVWQARDLVHCKGVGCTPRCLSGVPWSPPPLWFLCGRRGSWCTAKGSDVRPGVPPVSLGLHRSAGGFGAAGAGLGALQRGRMYAPVPLRCPLVSAAFVVFVWQARGLVHCKGVGCTPRCLSGVPWSPPPLWFLCGRRGIWCTAKGSDVRPGVPPVSLGLHRSAGGFGAAGAGLGALQRGRMYAPVPLRCSLVPAALPVALFAWQAGALALER